MATDEVRKILVKRLQEDKMRKLEEQRRYYQNKIVELKAKRKEKPAKRPTILSPRQLQLQRLKEKKEVRAYELEKYRQGKFQQAARIARASILKIPLQKRRFREYQLRRRGAVNGLPKQSLSSPSLNSREAFIRRLKIAAMRQGWNPQDLDNVAWSDFFETRLMEREVLANKNIGRGLSWLPAQEARTMENQIGLHNRRSNAGGSIVGFESKAHAKSMDINPARQLEAEVNAFANVLSPRRTTRRRR